MTAAARGRPSDGPEEFFDSLTGRAIDAVREGSVTHRLVVAGRSIDLVFAGGGLVDRILPALTHRVRPGQASAAFTIRIFDSATTGVRPPPPPWGPDDYLAQGEIAGYNDDRFKTFFQADAGCLSMIDLEAGSAVFWVRDPADYPMWMEAAPLRTIFGWWARGAGLQMIHGAGIGTESSGMLITARGGSGKSTSALRALLGGLRYAGDDYVVVDTDRRIMHSIYNTAKVDDNSIDRFFPHLRAASRGRVVSPDAIKHVFFLHETFGEQLGDVPMSMVALPRVSEAEQSSLESVSPAAALHALAPTTLFQLAGSGGQELRAMSRLVRAVPTYQLLLAPNDDLTSLLETVLAPHGGDGR